MTFAFGNPLVEVILSAWLVVTALACLAAYRAQRDRTDPWIPKGGEKTVVIMPVRGAPPHLSETWRGISAQTFQPARIVFAVESEADPAVARLRSLKGGPPFEIVVAGPTTRRAQKIHNLLAALATLKDSDDTVVFADADIQPGKDWLARLLKWHNRDNLDAVSGYRFLLPTDNRWSSTFVALVNCSIAVMPRPPAIALAWGGSMVLSRRTIAAIRLEQRWDRIVSDDLSLTQAIWAHGGTVHSPRDALVLSPASYSWREAIVFGRRQYLLVRIHTPLFWAVAAAGVTVGLAGWVVALPLAATADPFALGAICIAVILDRTGAFFRARVLHKILGIEFAPRTARLDRWGRPIVLLFHAVLVWSAAFGRRVAWAGRIYQVGAGGEVLSIQQ